MQLSYFLAASSIALWMALAGPASAAGDDHGHDHGAAAPEVGSASPRFSASSDAFELVGVVNGPQILLYLDRYADNLPVPDAKIELDIGGATVQAQQQGDATYLVTLAAAPPPGVLPITATVTAGNEVDLLAGELDVHEAAHVDGPAAPVRWTRWAVWASAGLAVLVLVFVLLRRRRMGRNPQIGGAA